MCADNSNILITRQKKLYGRFMDGVLNRFQSQWSKPEGSKEVIKEKEAKDMAEIETSSRFFKYSSGDEDYVDDTKWKLELAWLTKALEPALQLCRWALPIGLFYVNSC